MKAAIAPRTDWTQNRARAGLVLGAATCFTLLLAPRPARATELEPNEFVTAAPGTTALIGYFIYGDHDSYRPVGGPTAAQGAHFTDVLGIARGAKYFDIGNVEFLVEFLQPFGTYDDAKINGAKLSGGFGFGDTTLAAAVWPINDKARQTYLGVTLYLTVPDGTYDRSRSNNLGGNRMVYDPELAFHQGFGPHWSVDVSGDVIAYGDNGAASVLYHQTLTQKPTVQIQGFVNYAWPNTLVTSIGYESEFAGRQSLDRVETGGATNFEEIRFVNSYSITPAFQILGEVNHQFSNVGGFKQDLGVTIRTLYAF